MRDTTIYLGIIVLFSLPITTFAANNVNLISLDEPEQKELKDPRVSVDKKFTLHKPQNKNKQQPHLQAVDLLRLHHMRGFLSYI